METKNYFVKIHYLSLIFYLLFSFWLNMSLAATNNLGYKYHYVKIPVPKGYSAFNVVDIDDSGRIYGNAINTAGSHIAVYDKGIVNVLQPIIVSTVNAANNKGVMAGYVGFPDIDQQAAIFRGNKIEKLPYLPGKTRSYLTSINDFNTVVEYSNTSNGTFNAVVTRIYSKSKFYILPKNPSVDWYFHTIKINNNNIIVGNFGPEIVTPGYKVKLKPPNYKITHLFPIAEDINILSLNNTEHILGIWYSYLKTNMGIWDAKGNFKSYYDLYEHEEYDDQVLALFNDNNLIVLTHTDVFHYFIHPDSFLIPKPGIRLTLNSLLDNPKAAKVDLSTVTGINNIGDIVGNGCENKDQAKCSSYLLKRILPK